MNQAQRFEDKYIVPLMIESEGVDFLLKMQGMIESSIKSASERYDRLIDFINFNEISTIEELIIQFLEYKKLDGSGPDSIYKYRSALYGFMRIIGSDKHPNSITNNDIAYYRDQLLTKPKNWLTANTKNFATDFLSKQTVKNNLQSIRSFFSWAINEGKIKLNQNPAKNILVNNAKKKTKVIPSHPEADILMTIPSNARFKRCFKYIPYIARYTGCRMSEAAQLYIDDFVTINDVYCIRFNDDKHKKIKNENSKRLVPISEKLKPIINELIKSSNSDRIFDDRGDYINNDTGLVKIANGFNKNWNKTAKHFVAGITFHRWRDYAISEMANSGVQEIDRKRIVGHSDNSVHAGYTKNDLSRMKQAVDTIY